MNVSAIIVTRGNVDLTEILESLPAEWETVVWDNGANAVYVNGEMVESHRANIGVYGRYVAIEYAAHDLIYVQDDDCVVGDPQAIVDALPLCDQPYVVWDGSPPSPGVHKATRCTKPAGHPKQHFGVGGSWPQGILFPQDNDSPSGDPSVVCNMPSEFRHDFYSEHALVGFGAGFHRDAPARAFEQFGASGNLNHWSMWEQPNKPPPWWDDTFETVQRWEPGLFLRTCDVVFTALTPRILVDVPKRNLPWADGPDRMWRQKEHVWERKRMLELALKAAHVD